MLDQSYWVAVTAAAPHGNTMTVPAGIVCPTLTVKDASPSPKSEKLVDDVDANSLSFT